MTQGMERWQGRVAIVTGASTGIGAAICLSLVDNGMHVVGVARSLDKIQALSNQVNTAKGGSLTAMKCDITKDEEVERVFQQVLDKFGAVHCCVNNAGLSAYNSLLEGTMEEWRQMLQVNILGLCLFTKLTVNSMKQRGIDDGQIVQISSVCSHIVANIPCLHFYTATKHAVRALTEGLRQELMAAKSHIRVTQISPGLVETPFFKNMIGDEAQAKSFLGDIKCLESKDVANSVLHVLSAPAYVAINDIVLRPVEEDF